MRVQKIFSDKQKISFQRFDMNRAARLKFNYSACSDDVKLFTNKIVPEVQALAEKFNVMIKLGKKETETPGRVYFLNCLDVHVKQKRGLIESIKQMARFKAFKPLEKRFFQVYFNEFEDIPKLVSESKTNIDESIELWKKKKLGSMYWAEENRQLQEDIVNTQKETYKALTRALKRNK